MVVDQNMFILIAVGVVALLLIGMLWLVSSRARMDSEERRITAQKSTSQISAVLQANTVLENRIKIMSENHAIGQEEIKRAMHERLDAVSKRVGDSIEEAGFCISEEEATERVPVRLRVSPGLDH